MLRLYSRNNSVVIVHVTFRSTVHDDKPRLDQAFISTFAYPLTNCTKLVQAGR